VESPPPWMQDAELLVQVIQSRGRQWKIVAISPQPFQRFTRILLYLQSRHNSAFRNVCGQDLSLRRGRCLAAIEQG